MPENITGPGLDGASAGGLFVKIGADWSGLPADLEQAHRVVQQASDRMEKEATVKIRATPPDMAQIDAFRSRIDGPAFRGSGGPGGRADVGRFRNDDLIGEFTKADTKAKGFGERIKALASPLNALRSGVLSVTRALFGWTAIIGTVGTALVGFTALVTAAWKALVLLGEKAEVTSRILQDPLLRVIDELASRDTIINVGALRKDVEAIDELAARIIRLKEEIRNAENAIGGDEFNPLQIRRRKELAEAIEEERQALERLNRAGRENNRLRDEEIKQMQTLNRLIREQRGNDISKTAIDPSRFGQWLDILQRQRAAEAGA